MIDLSSLQHIGQLVERVEKALFFSRFVTLLSVMFICVTVVYVADKLAPALACQ